MTGALWEAIARARVFDLGQPMRRGMPQSPNSTPFRLVIEHRHGDAVREDGGSMASEVILTGGHVGTHIDGFAHVSQNGVLRDGVPAGAHVSFDGFSRFGIHEFAPFLGRGVLLDVAKLRGVATLAPGEAVTAEDLEAARRAAGVELRPGDAILVGTGWSRTWDDDVDFVGAVGGAPGPDVSAGRWLADHAPAIVAGETLAFEHIPPGRGHARLEVHTLMLVERGIHIMEALRLSELLDAGAAEFTFVVSPLPLVGSTGAPVRPLALVESDPDEI